jgi:hypothetical protein
VLNSAKRAPEINKGKNHAGSEEPLSTLTKEKEPENSVSGMCMLYAVSSKLC